MSVIFMTEKEADDLIEANIDYLVSKIKCATQCRESGAGIGLTGACDAAQCDQVQNDPPAYLCCGCCENDSPGTEPWRNL